MIVKRVVDDEGNIEFVTPDGLGWLSGLHSKTDDCTRFGCIVHSPTLHALSDAPLNWREDRVPGIFERICEHNVGHPDFDQANYSHRVGRDYDNVHGCCVERCCA